MLPSVLNFSKLLKKLENTNYITKHEQTLQILMFLRVLLMKFLFSYFFEFSCFLRIVKQVYENGGGPNRGKNNPRGTSHNFEKQKTNYN